MSTYHLFKWSVGMPDNNFMAPELRTIHLVGFRDKDSKRIRTSYIVSVKGCEVKTSSGSTYILEDIDLEYLQWLNDQGIDYDPDNPIKMKDIK